MIADIHKQKAFSFVAGLLWLFQVSAIIGITLGHQDWFITQTPMLLIINALVVIVYYPVDTWKKALIALFIAIGGMIAEWVGVHHDFLFGPYYYGENLGPKIYDVPYLIGANWMVLVLATSAMAYRFFSSTWLVIVGGSALMIVLDFFIEKSAPPFDFWIWETHAAPLRNYISWFLIALVLHLMTVLSKSTSRSPMMWHVYLSQLVFFVYFYVYHSV